MRKIFPDGFSLMETIYDIFSIVTILFLVPLGVWKLIELIVQVGIMLSQNIKW